MICLIKFSEYFSKSISIDKGIEDTINNSSNVKALASVYVPSFLFLPGCTLLCYPIDPEFIVLVGDGFSQSILLYVDKNPLILSPVLFLG